VILQIRIELLKLRTLRLTYGLTAAAAGLSVLFSGLAASRAGSANAHAAPLPPLSSVAGITTVTTTTGFALLMSAVLGITLSTGEFRYGTATLTYLSCPDRNRVLAAKAAAAAVVGALIGLVGAAGASLTGLAFAAARGDADRLGAASVAGHVLGTALAAALLAAAGVGLGSLLRSQLGAVIGVFTWALIGETLLGGFYRASRPYLPYAAATGLGGTPPGEAALGLVRTGPGAAPLPFAACFALILGVTIALCAAAAAVTLQRDIT
jgi:ABC-2 type transport system permease protein